MQASDYIAAEAEILLASDRKHALDLLSRVPSQRERRLRLLVGGQVAIIEVRPAMLAALVVVVRVVLQQRVRFLTLAPWLVFRVGILTRTTRIKR